MLNCINGYWSKNEKKPRTLIALIDNHESKCNYADKTLASFLKNGDIDRNMKFKTKADKNYKSKKLKKKKRKSSKG